MPGHIGEIRGFRQIVKRSLVYLHLIVIAHDSALREIAIPLAVREVGIEYLNYAAGLAIIRGQAFRISMA